MMQRRTWLTALGLGGLTLAARAADFVDPLRVPAVVSALAARSPMLDVTRAGKRLVACGLRGHIVYSEDGGAHWEQARVPLSVDLVALSFPTPSHGWAVGHSGTVLATIDGGRNWQVQLAGRQSADLALAHYREHAGPDIDSQRALKQAHAQAEGALQPFLDVSFESMSTGWAVGAFNRIFKTEDGGKQWVPCSEAVPNPGQLHLYSVATREGYVYLAGEQGKVWRKRADEPAFTNIATPYNGTLFAVLPAEKEHLLALGMRGSLYLSTNNGASWERIETGSAAGLTSGVALEQGRIVLATQAGTLLTSTDAGKHFRVAQLPNPMPYWGIASIDTNQLVLAGPGGLGTARLP